MKEQKIEPYSLVIQAVEKYAKFLEENWEDADVLNCAKLIRCLGFQHMLMEAEIERLRGDGDDQYPPYPFDGAAILASPSDRRIRMSFASKETYDAAVSFLKMESK